VDCGPRFDDKVYLCWRFATDLASRYFLGMSNAEAEVQPPNLTALP